MTNQNIDTPIFLSPDGFSSLSNFSAFQIMWKGRCFPTAEHTYQWEKFNGPGGGYVQSIIANATSPYDAFQIGQKYISQIQEGWPTLRVPTVSQILRCKTEQHEYIKFKLLQTGDREIIQDNWADRFWGWGEDKQGFNMLGKIWMEIRDDIRQREGAKNE